MADDNNNLPGESGGPGTDDKGGSDKGTPNEDGKGTELSLEEIKAVMLKKSGLSEDDYKRVLDQERNDAVSSFKKKSDKDKKAKNKEKSAEEAEKKRLKDIEKLEGAEHDKAVAEEKLLQAEINHTAIFQRECRAVLKAEGFGGLPTGIVIESEEVAEELAEYLKKLRPAGGGGKPPGLPSGDASPKPVSKEAEMKAKSQENLSKRHPWFKKKE